MSETTWMVLLGVSGFLTLILSVSAIILSSLLLKTYRATEDSTSLAKEVSNLRTEVRDSSDLTIRLNKRWAKRTRDEAAEADSSTPTDPAALRAHAANAVLQMRRRDGS